MVTRDIIQRLLGIINDTRARVNTLESKEVALLTATQTLTNKTLTTPTIGDYTNAQHAHTNAASGGTISHGSLTGLTTGDPHTQYTLLAGRSGGQTLIGGTAANDDLTLEGTSNATRTTSYVVLQPNGGNVGIGMTGPGNFNGLTFGDAILDVYGVIQVRGDATNNVAALNLGGDTYRKATILTPVDTADPYLSFNVSTSGTTSSAPERMRITNTGNVGIGTVSPNNRLEVNVSNNTTTLYVDASYPLRINNTSTTDNSYAGMYFGSGLGVGATIQAVYPNASTRAEANLLLSTRNSGGSLSERMRITSGGNVGIGTVNPDNFNGLTFGDAILDVYGAIQVRSDATNNVAALNLGGDTYRKAAILTPVDTADPYLSFYVSTSGTTSSAPERMRILSNGNVGIGTTSPSRKLHVVGTILVDGDEGGIAGTIGLTDGSDLSARSTGVGTIKFNDATNRDSSGFVKIYIGTTDYYIPVFAAI